MDQINIESKKGMGLKEKIEYEGSYLIERIKDTVLDASGTTWMFNNASSKVWDGLVFLILTYVRLWVKVGMFIAIMYGIGYLFFPHSMGK